MIVARWLLVTLLLLCGCTGIDTDAPGLDKEDVRVAFERGIVLAGMTPRQVRFVWGEPRQRRTTATGEQWTYEPDVPATGVGYHALVTVAFTKDRVDSVMNGDLKLKRTQMGTFDDLAHRAPRPNDSNYWSPGFQSGGVAGAPRY